MNNINYIILGSQEFFDKYKLIDNDIYSKAKKINWENKDIIPCIIDNYRNEYFIISEKYDKFLDDINEIFNTAYKVVLEQ